MASDTEFIDGLQQFHSYRNAWSRPSPSGLSLEPLDASILFWHVSHGNAISHAVLLVWLSPFILGINFFIGAIVFGLLASSYHLSRATPSSKATLRLGLPFFFPRLGVILIGVIKVPETFHILWEYLGRPRPGPVVNHRCWCRGLAGDCLFRPPAHIFWSCSAQSTWASGQGLSLPPYGALDLGFCHCVYAECRAILIVAMLITPATDGLSLYQ